LADKLTSELSVRENYALFWIIGYDVNIIYASSHNDFEHLPALAIQNIKSPGQVVEPSTIVKYHVSLEFIYFVWGVDYCSGANPFG